ncbi:MAG: pseudouridine-5'-phosphate glycosidase [Acidobacteriota bacterium]|nr:MAG: pseudouridine-5'-phosphate glycosidase [Acidobacteriota bacterium]
MSHLAARVALESSLTAHGLPYPLGVRTALSMERIVREQGAHPRSIGVIDGAPVVGLSPSQIRRLGRRRGVAKVGIRNLPVVLARAADGGTTVAATAHLAARAGIPVMVTGGIGGVHRSGLTGPLGDVSADLETLAHEPIVVVCSGAKAILDLPATIERLESLGVTVVGFGTDEFPAFYSRSSGLAVDDRCETAQDVAEIFAARRRQDLRGGVIVAVPIPRQHEIRRDEIEPAIERALEDAARANVRAAALTPFLLSRLAQLTAGRALDANVALLENNAAVAGRIGLAIAAHE